MPPSNSPGQLTSSVEWFKRSSVTDDYGNTQGAFATQFSTLAGFTHLRGTESVMAARLEGRQPVVVRVWSTSNTRLIRPDWQMQDKDTLIKYAVRSVSPTPDRRWIDVLVEQGVAA